MSIIKSFYIGFLLIVAGHFLHAQEITQRVRGVVTDAVSSAPLAGASIRLVGPTELVLTTDESGAFTADVVPGRYRFTVSFTGYENVTREILVISGRQTVANVQLNATTRMLETIEVQSETTIDELPGAQSISIEKTMRMPANFFDPVRAMTSYPGVIAANDQNNSIVVRGNSPNGLLWRLNGLDIVNPNHLANAGTFSDRPAASGGGVNILSAQMLDRTNFYTGWVPAGFGNTTAAAIDMHLREGNKVKDEYIAQASLIGIDVTAEGPFNKETRKSSYLANYRYSTVGLLSAMGVDFGDEKIGFEDLSFNFDFDLGKRSSLSVFAFAGNSKNRFERKDPTDWEVEKDQYDINYDNTTAGVGINYSHGLPSGRLFFATGFSSSQQERLALGDGNGTPGYFLRFDRLEQGLSIFSSNVFWESTIKSGTVLKIGSIANYQQNSFLVHQIFVSPTGGKERMIVNDYGGGLLQPYAEATINLGAALQAITGLQYAFYTFNNTSSIEPRVTFQVAPSRSAGFNLGYALVSQLQQPQTYARNPDLEFTKSHHIDATYYQHLSENMKLKAGAFYQSLFDVPVELTPSSYSALNQIDELAPASLVSDGTGENYGVDGTLEKYFFTSSYLLVGASYYESKYKGSDGVKRDTRFNGNYTFTGVYGREWKKKEKNRTIGVNTRLLYLGGFRESDILSSQSQAEGETVYDTTDPFTNKLADYLRLDLRVSFTKDKPTHTRTFAIDIQNVFGNENESLHYYDVFQDRIVTKYQLGIIPVLVYRIEF